MKSDLPDEDETPTTPIEDLGASLELDDDFYSITWLTLYKYYVDKEIKKDKRQNMGLQTIYVGEKYKSLVEDLPKVSPVSPAKNLSCCIFIFML